MADRERLDKLVLERGLADTRSRAQAMIMAGQIVVDGSPETLTRQVDDALTTLKLDRVDLFQLHRVDPEVPIEDSVGALEAARRAGKVDEFGERVEVKKGPVVDQPESD